MPNNENYIGGVIKRTRESNGISVEKCAEQVGISARYLQKIENEGNIPSFKTLRKIVHVLAMDANYLFYENYDINSLVKNNVAQKLQKCNDYELNVVLATLNALLENR